MQSIMETIIERVRTRVQEKEFIAKHKRKAGDFTRKRNLSFAEIMSFVIGNLGTSLDFEVMNFCAERSQAVTPAAISKARDKIKSSAFEEIFRLSGELTPVRNMYRGYRLTAYDGMQGELPKTQELLRLSDGREKGSYPEFHAVAEYDILNCCYTNAMIEIGTSDERKVAIELLKKHEYEGAEIYLLDRGFPSLKMIQEIEKSGKKYVMRVSNSFLREINEFRKSKAKDTTIQIDYDKTRGTVNKVKDVKLPYSFTVRCVKIELNSGEDEILATNLAKEEFSCKSIGELYNLRWKIETSFLHLKYAVCIEDFMGIKENSIKQEFFASLFKANLFMQFTETANDVIYNKKNDKTRIQG